MGVDISMYSEVRKKGRWQFHEPSADFQEKMELSKAEYNVPIYSIRNRQVYSLLVGYESSNSNANPLLPISPPKGKPIDISPEVARELLALGSDAFDTSWLTLEEIQAYDWNKLMKCTGYVDPKYKGYFINRPKTFPPEVPRVSGFSKKWAKVNWFQPVSETGGQFYSDVIPYLCTLGQPEDVRVVFWLEL